MVSKRSKVKCAKGANYTGWDKKVEFCGFLQEFEPEKFLNKNVSIEVILCEESIMRILETWKCFPDPDSEKMVVYWSKNELKFEFLL
jgi:hypothetical protein